ncbi:putative coiled-coil domain-containing protein 17 [Scophthalmus maximus]|uniref:Putative coiled-coil domain-containing protein 17 n=1 Tax=Scophthalmus maximus TaxID=52904 RepID=A0A2U9C687_SCOMX|nr:putative coiled-coil domain-containing protein 17 [Scophthalmus maximus]
MREMAALHERRVALMHAHNLQLEQRRDDPAGNYKMHHDKCKLIAPAGGPLSTQIGALRRAYTQSGGSDPAIVAQMIDLQAEAQSLEKNEAASAKATGKRENDEPLYSEGVEAGPPTPLPPVRCLPGVSSPCDRRPTPGDCVPLSVKLPVPRIQPSPSLCLVVEVQAARDLDVQEQEVFRMVSSGWTRLELFDPYNQLRSGHWRAPVRSLPIRPSLSIDQLNSIPQVGNMELWVRLVKGRDEDVQTLEKPEPTSTRHYRYPDVASSPHATVQGNAALPVSAPQSRGVTADEASLLSFDALNEQTSCAEAKMIPDTVSMLTLIKR